jgi:nucleotide-binding universal stress UspA family protein
MAGELKKIMVATDGSKAAENAVRYAARLAKRRGTELLILHVVSYKRIGYWAFIDTHFKKELIQAGGKILEAAEALAKQYEVPCRSLIREAEKLPHLAFVEAVEELNNVWVLVLGDKGQDLEDRQTLGSTTDGVLHELSKRKVPVPVLVVPYVEGVELTV